MNGKGTYYDHREQFGREADSDGDAEQKCVTPIVGQCALDDEDDQGHDDHESQQEIRNLTNTDLESIFRPSRAQYFSDTS